MDKLTYTELTLLLDAIDAQINKYKDNRLLYREEIKTWKDLRYKIQMKKDSTSIYE